MLEKTISILFLFAAGFLLFLAARGFTYLGSPTNNGDIDTLKIQAIEYIKQNKQIDANSAIKTILTNYTTDTKFTATVYELAELYRSLSKFQKALELYKVATEQPQSKETMYAKRGEIICNIALGKLDTSKELLEKLKSDYSAVEPNKTAEVVFNIGDAHYWLRGESGCKDANSCYQWVLQNYPGNDYSLWATMGLAISSISNKDQNSAEIYISNLSSDYKKNSKLPEALYYIGSKYGYNRDYKRAISIYDDIKTKWPENTWGKNAEFETTKIGVFQYLDKKDEPNTLKAVDKLITDFNRPDLPAVVLDIAARSDWQNKYEPNNLTKQLYNRVIKHFSKSPQADIAKICNLRNTAIAFINISDDVNAFTTVGTIIADFNNNPKAPEEIWRIAERYYGNGMRGIVNRYQSEAAADNFRKSILIKEKMINYLPSNKYTPMALSSIGLLYTQHLGEYKKGIEYIRCLINKWPDYGGLDNSYFILGKYLELLKARGEVTAQEADLEIENSYKIILEKYPQSKALPYAAHRLGRVYYAKGDITKATDYLLTAFNAALSDKKCGEISMMVNLLGQIYEKQGQTDIAQQIYQAYVDWAEPNDTRANPIRAKLAKMEGGVR